MVMTLDLRVMDFTDLGKVSNACAMQAQNSQELASCIVLENQSLIIVDSDCMDMQIRKYLHSVWKACLVSPPTSAHCGYWLPPAAPLSAVTATETNQRTNDFMQSCHFTTVEVTIKYYVMFQIVFASLHQAVLITGSHMISTRISMWHLDMCYVLGSLHNHLRTHSTTTDKYLKLQTSPPAAEDMGM